MDESVDNRAVPLHSAEALILSVADLHDRDRIVVFLTRDLGKKRGVAKGARTRHSRYAGQLQPLAKVQVTWFAKEGAELARISSVELVRAAGKLLEDLDDLLLGAYLTEHLLEFAQEDEVSEPMFRLLDTTIEALLEGIDRDLAARYFESWILRLGGIFPAPRECPQCGEDLAVKGATLPRGADSLLCLDCGGRHGLILRSDTIDFLRRIGRQNLTRAAEEPPAPAVLREVEEICARVRRSFLQRELRSYGVLEQIRSGR